MNSTSPDVTIPDVPITDYVLRHAARLRDKPALIDGPTGRTLTYGQLADRRPPRGGGARRARVQEGRRFAIYSPNLPEYGLVYARRGVAGRDHHHRQPALHRRRAGQAALGLPRAIPRHRAPVPRQGHRGGAQERGGGGLRVRRGGGRAPVQRAAPGGRHAAGGAHRSGERHRGAPVLERDHRAAQGRDAHPPEPGGQPLPVLGHGWLRPVRRAGRRDRRAAVLPHLRHGRDHDARAWPAAPPSSRCRGSTWRSSWASCRSTRPPSCRSCRRSCWAW